MCGNLQSKICNQARRKPEAVQEPLLRVGEAPIEVLEHGAALLPELAGRHEQAGVIGRLQQVA